MDEASNKTIQSTSFFHMLPRVSKRVNTQYNIHIQYELMLSKPFYLKPMTMNEMNKRKKEQSIGVFAKKIQIQIIKGKYLNIYKNVCLKILGLV